MRAGAKKKRRITSQQGQGKLDQRDKKIRRLAWRSIHRGTREVDLLLGDFADKHLPLMDDATLSAFEAFLSFPDPQMHAWLTHQMPLPGGMPKTLHDMLEAFEYQPKPRAA